MPMAAAEPSASRRLTRAPLTGSRLRQSRPSLGRAAADGNSTATVLTGHCDTSAAVGKQAASVGSTCACRERAALPPRAELGPEGLTLWASLVRHIR